MSAPANGTVVPPLAQPVAIQGQGDIASLVERLKPTVVNITTTSVVPVSENPFPIPLPFNHPQPRGERHAKALGTGFIVDPAGLVVTNAHVIQGAEDIKVRLADEREFPGKIVGKDPLLDLAVVKIEGASNLSAVTMGDSDALRVGDWVLAIGNPFGLGHTVTLGITSAKDRSIGAGPYDAFIQTDASINPGNSGGALFNLKGEVVGIPTMIRANAQGIGFAVPVNALKDVLPQLRDKGTVTRGKLGVHIQHVTEELAKTLGLEKPRGALVAAVEPGSAGAKAGIQPGDVIVSVNGLDVPHSEDLPRMVARNQPGQTVKLVYVRNAQKAEANAVLDLLVPEEDDDEAPTPAGMQPPPATGSKLGVSIDDAPGGGARIRGVAPTSPASGQLEPGDVVTEVDHQPVKTALELQKKLEAAGGGKTVLLRVRRGPEQRFVALTLAK